MPRKAAKKTKSKIEIEAAETTAAQSPVPAHEPDEPEFEAISKANVAGGDEPTAPLKSESAEAEAFAMAEAADTFEQAYEERVPGDRQEPGEALAETSEPEAAGAAGSQEPVEPELTHEDEKERPPARLERLQKILSQAGVASRRHAEEMITEGRVQVNGKVVTELGSKADPERDHIRVDGKLLHGAERLRYFMLNKPKGYVTTVSDPEGRPTVMEFFKKMGERLYPVGRLDYQSEGLLLVTNDGDLANKMTKASTGVEKVYLVKVSGQPTEEDLNRLREGVVIDRGRPGEGRVTTGGATIREARAGDNPWYEVVLTEGRNRELRKMFEEIGHHVEKIRRVGYGPLVLDVEPGQLRELEPDELAKLRLAAEGKWRKPKPKEPRTQMRRDGGRRESGRRERPERQAGRREAGTSGPPRGDRPAKLRGGEDRRGVGERRERTGFGPRRQGGGSKPESREQDFRTSRPKPAGRAEEFRGRSTGPAKPQGSRPFRERPERQGEGFVRRDRAGAPPRNQADRLRFEKREDRGGVGERPRRGPAPQGRFEAPRPQRPQFGRGEDFGRRGFGGSGAQGSRPRGGSGGAENRPSPPSRGASRGPARGSSGRGPGRGPGGGGSSRAAGGGSRPFKSNAVRRPGSPARPSRGPRGRRPE